MTKEEAKRLLKEEQTKGEAPESMTWMGYSKAKSIMPDSSLTINQRFREIAKNASKYMPENKQGWEDKFYKVLSEQWLIPSTPVFSNLGTDRGMAVSCSASRVNDSMWDIAYTDMEIAMLGKNGFGTSTYLNLRPSYSPISGGGHTNKIEDWVEKYWQTQNTVSQGSTRRGSNAIYIDFKHDNLLDVLNMLKTHELLHLGVCMDDSDIEMLKSGDDLAMKKWQRILYWRKIKGKPYIINIDNVNRQNPDMYKARNLEVSHSNLCSEIFLHTSSEYTMSCVLSSMNLAKFDEWKDTDAVFVSTVFLDCIAEDLIQRGTNIKGLERVVDSTRKGRALGLGTLGFHTYLQQKDIVFGSFESRLENGIIYSNIKQEALNASKWLATKLGEPDWCKGYGVRNTHLLAIAPNTSTGLIAGSVSQGIEPFASNVFQQKLPHIGQVERINPVLLKKLKEMNKYTPEVIDSIAFNNGSVQHLDFLDDHTKQVFLTAFETNQKHIIDLAEQRQAFICQGQSLNLFFGEDESEEVMHEVHKYALEQKRLKSLYYVRTLSGVKGDNDLEACESCSG